MSETIDRVGLTAGLDTAGVAWRELDDADREAYAVDGVQPRAICWPSTDAEAARALEVANRLSLAVSPRGAGTKIGLGNPPKRVDLIVSTERLAGVVEYAPANLTVTVQAGTTLAALQKRLAEGGQFLPLDPPEADRCTIGGIIASNASGPRRFGFGAARDLVLGIHAATTSGIVTRSGGRVVKNVAGYDLNKLYIGSLGTLVLVAEVTFKVAPRPASQTTVIGRFEKYEQLSGAVRSLVQSPLMPVAIDALNAGAVERAGLVGIPEVGSGYLLAVLGTAPGRAVRRQRDDVTRVLRENGSGEVVDLADAQSEEFWAHVAEWTVRSGQPDEVRLKISTPINRVADVIRAIAARTELLGPRPAVGGRVGSGILYVTWRLGDGRVDPLSANGTLVKETAEGIRELRSLCQGSGGSLVIEACPRGLKDSLDVWGDVGSSLGLMGRLKTALDPQAIMNPGRFVGGI